MGALLGALAYLIFVSGFIAATGIGGFSMVSGNSTMVSGNSTMVSTSSNYFLILISALAGFSARWSVKLLEKITTMIKVG